MQLDGEEHGVVTTTLIASNAKVLSSYYFPDCPFSHPRSVWRCPYTYCAAHFPIQDLSGDAHTHIVLPIIDFGCYCAHFGPVTDTRSMCIIGSKVYKRQHHLCLGIMDRAKGR
jgi:hypothetical protein